MTSTGIIADSVHGFSKTQGKNGWYYGYYPGPFSPSSFVKFPAFGPAPGNHDGQPAWFEDTSHWTQLWADGGHPNGQNSNNDVQWAVRRWISPVSGSVTISGLLAKDPSGIGGNGIAGHIFENGTQIWSDTLAGGDTKGLPYELPVSVKKGTKVDFAIDPLGDDSYDSTTFTVHIILGSPVPSGGAVGPNGCNGSGSPDNPTACDSHACKADPVDCADGNFTESANDLSIPSRGYPLAFDRTYNSSNAGESNAEGFGWSGNEDINLATAQTPDTVTIHEEGGTQVTFTDVNGTWTAPPRVVATLVQNSDDSWTFVRENRDAFHFSKSGELLSETDLNGNSLTYTYKGGHVNTVTDSSGRKLTVSWTGSHITKVTDPIGRYVRFTYDTRGNLVQARDVNGAPTSYTYDSKHRMLTMTDSRGIATQNVYDSSGRVIEQILDPTTKTHKGLNRVTKWTYTGDNLSATGGTTLITDPMGRMTLEHYQYGEMQSETKGYGTKQAATSEYTYDPATLGTTSVTDPLGHGSSKTYDASGNVLTSTDALGRTTTYTYNQFNEPLTVTDPLGEVTTSTDDANGNLTSTSRPGPNGNQTTTYTYGDSSHPGDVTSMVDPDGNTWTYTYDKYGDKASSTDLMGDETTYSYNTIGWLLSQTSPNGNVTGVNPALFTTAYSHDNFGNVTATTDPLGHKTTRTYDADQNLIAVKDAEGQTTRYGYDAANEQTAVIRPDGTTLGTRYDADGEVMAQIDGAGNATTYAYDALGRVTATTDPLNRTTKFAYDADGNRVAVTNPLGEVTRYGYDAGNELTSITYSGGKTANVTNIMYDADGQRTSMTDGTGTSTWTYNSLNELTGYTNGAGAATAYDYDLAGNLTTLTYPNGREVTQTYDAAERLSSIKDWLNNITSFSYDHDSNLTTETFPARTNETDTYAYDNADNLIGIDDTQGITTLAAFDYTRNPDNLLASSSTTGISAPNETYDYTKLNQLGSVNTQTYGYDKADNITTLANGCTQIYDKGNELKTSKCGRVTTSFGYNADGDRTIQSPSSGTPSTYAYDQADRLADFARGSTTATYTYDGDGLRMRKTVNGGTPQEFAWIESGSLPLMLQSGAASFVYGPGELPLEQINAGSVYYYHHDQIGSTRFMTNSVGSIVATRTYDAYGNVTSQTQTAGTPALQLTYGGQFFDSESGLMYLRARYYDPIAAQFMSIDPQVSTTQVPYGYVGDDPLNLKDPSGMSCVQGILQNGNFTVFKDLSNGRLVVEDRECFLGFIDCTTYRYEVDQYGIVYDTGGPGGSWEGEGFIMDAAHGGEVQDALRAVGQDLPSNPAGSLSKLSAAEQDVQWLLQWLGETTSEDAEPPE